MQKNDQYAAILDKVLTAEQLKDSIQLLRDAHQGLFTPGVSPKDILETSLPYFITENIFSVAQQNNISLDDTAKVQNMLDEVRQYLEQLQVVEMSLAFVPTYRQLQKIKEWWENYTGAHTIVSIKYDEAILAGAKISFNGLYRDYSLLYWISQNAQGDIEQFI